MEIKGDYAYGTTFKSQVGDYYFIIDVKSSKEVTVMFYDGYYTTTQMSNVRRGNVRNPFSVYGRFHGFGVTDVPAVVNGKRNKYARMWEAMISRVFSGKDKAYSDVAISKDWELLSTFLNDVKDFVGYDKVIYEGWVLDKDILSNGRKIYSKDSCCFVPPKLNSFMVSYNKPKGDYLLGVHFCNREKKFVAQGRIDGKQKGLGYFDNEVDAHEAYLKNKQQQLVVILDEFSDDLCEKVVVALKEKFKLTD